jgi:lysozyme family protein
MADLKTAFLITIEHEGGYQCMPDDSGNWTGGKVGVGELKGTKYGISARQFPRLDIKNLTEDSACNIYRNLYWTSLYNQIADQSIANKLFDMGVLFGVGESVYLLKRALNFPTEKWAKIFDIECLDAVNAAEPVSLLNQYKIHLEAHATNITSANENNQAFIEGWKTRINS